MLFRSAEVRPALFLFMLAEELPRPFLPSQARDLAPALSWLSPESLASLPLVAFLATVALLQLPFPLIIGIAALFGLIGGRVMPDRFQPGGGHPLSRISYGPALIDDDADITCYGIQSRMRADASVVREARALWFTERDTPASCGPLFTHLLSTGQLTTQEVWTRVRWALAAGQVGIASRASALLPPGQAPNTVALNAVLKNPGGQLARPFDAASKPARETQMFAVYRLARVSARQAAGLWVTIESRFQPDERSFKIGRAHV